MFMAMENDHDFDVLINGDDRASNADLGWHISFRLAAGFGANGIDPRAMLGTLATMGECRVIGRDGMSPLVADRDAARCPISWDMVLVGDTTRTAIEGVFAGLPDAMELVIKPIH